MHIGLRTSGLILTMTFLCFSFFVWTVDCKTGGLIANGYDC